MHEVAVGGGKYGGVPSALRLASGHDKVRAVRVPRHGFHEAGTVLALFDLINALAVLPIPALPGHLAVAGHRVRHGPHATAEEGFSIGGEGKTVDAATIMVGLDRAPGGEVRRGPLRLGFGVGSRLKFPDANFTHHVARADVLSVATERATENRRRVGERRDEFSGR